MNTVERNILWAEMMVEAMRLRGVDHFVICPGSRSSPLVLALSEEKRISRIVHQDERGAGYFTVGYARATGGAAAVVTTSGTAAVSLFPAIVEASMDNLPLVAITADRPPELHDCGANQTIDQVSLYGEYVRASIDFPCPDDIPDLNVSVEEIDQALEHALGQSQVVGPVHFNCRFREPLVPSLEPERQVAFPPQSRTSHDATSPELSSGTVAPIVKSIRASSRGLLLIGQLRNDAERRAALELSAQLNWPTLADVTSGVHDVDNRQLITHYDLVLASHRFAKHHAPDTILHVGGRVTSKRLLQFIEYSHPASYLHNSGDGVVFDPVRAVTERTSFDNASFCRSVSEHLQSTKTDAGWLEDWIEASQIARRKIIDACESEPALTEPALVVALSQEMDHSTSLFLASSMPIRDMDMFGIFNCSMPVASNRGTSGIDGTIASACGYAAGLNRSVTLLIGDQAFLHDLSSLSLVRQSELPVVIVAVNNNGGRIFELLPISEHKRALEPLFVAPHGLTLRKFAEGFGIPYAEARTGQAFDDAYSHAITGNSSMVIEAFVDPTASRERRLRLIEAVKKEVDQCRS